MGDADESKLRPNGDNEEEDGGEETGPEDDDDDDEMTPEKDTLSEFSICTYHFFYPSVYCSSSES